MGKAVFHDGIRPILPEVIEGRMSRKELGNISYGLSIGFIVSIGMSFALSFQMLNPWLLWLPTDIIGIVASRWWIAMLLGAAWGAIACTGVWGLLALFSNLPINMVDPLVHFGSPIVIVISFFPVIAILQRFGWKKALPSAAIVLTVWLLMLQITNPDTSYLAIVAPTLVAIIMLVGFVVHAEYKVRRQFKSLNDAGKGMNPDREMEQEQLLNLKKVRKALPLMMAIGSCTAMASYLGIFSGSDMAMPLLQSAHQASDMEQSAWYLNAALVDIVRMLCFVPLITVTALATGVSGVAGLMLVFPIGYLSPNLITAGILGACIVLIEGLVLRKLSNWFEGRSMIREAADYTRSAMNALMEIGFLIGGALAVLSMEGNMPGIGLTFYVLLYLTNEMIGRPVMRVAVGPVAAIISGLLLNLVYYVQLI